MFHIHRWKVVYKRDAQIVQQCRKCNAYRSKVLFLDLKHCQWRYRWIKGNKWMLPPIKAKLSPPVMSEIIELVD